MEQENQLTGLGLKTIHVTVPAKAMFDLEAMQQIQRDVLGRLGCQACCSGFDIRFDIARRFVVDEELGIRAAGEGM